MLKRATSCFVASISVVMVVVMAAQAKTHTCASGFRWCSPTKGCCKNSKLLQKCLLLQIPFDLSVLWAQLQSGTCPTKADCP